MSYLNSPGGSGGGGGRTPISANPTGIYVSTISFAPVGTYNVSTGTFDQGPFLTGGSGYPNGSYSNVPLTGGSGSGQKANIFVDFGFNITNGGTGYAGGGDSEQYYPVTGGSGTGGIVLGTVAAGVVTALRWVERGTGYLAGDVISVQGTGFGNGTGFSATLTTNSGKVTFVQPINLTATTPYAVGDNLSASNTNLGGAGSGFSAHIYAIGSDTTGDGSEAKPYATLQNAFNVFVNAFDTGTPLNSIIFQIVDGFYTETGSTGVWLDTAISGAWVGYAAMNILGNNLCKTCVQSSRIMNIAGNISLPNEIFIYSLGARRFQMINARGFIDVYNCDVGINGGNTQNFWVCQGFGSNLGVHGDVTMYSGTTSAALFSQQGGFVNFGINSITINGSRTISTAFCQALEHSYQTSGGPFTVVNPGGLTCPNQVSIDDMGRVDVSFGGLGLNAYPGAAFGTVKNGGAYVYSGAGGRRCIIGSDSETVKTLFTTSAALTLANGLNSNIDISAGGSYFRIAGPTGAFSLGGFAPSTQVPSADGAINRIYNPTSNAMTIVNEDASSTAANRIKTLSGANIVLPAGTSSAQFIYDGTDLRWVYMGSGTAGGGTPGGSSGQVQYNNSGAFGGFGNWDGTSILEQRNGTNAQAFRVYNTFTDASNYERGIFDWTTNSNVLTISPQAAGTGTLRRTYLSIDAPAGDDGAIQYFSQSGSGILLGKTVGITNFGSVGTRVQLPTNGHLTWTSGGNPFNSFSVDLGLWHISAGVLGISAGDSTTIDGWFQWGGQARVTSDFSKTTDVTLANVTGLSVNVKAGRTYTFRVYLHVSPDAAGGHQYAVAGTCTATAIIYQVNSVNNSTNANIINSRQTALGGAAGVVGGTVDYTEIVGTITVNAAGTLTVQFAQQVSSGTSKVLTGSFMEVNDIA